MGQNYEVQFAKQLDGTDNYGNVTYSVKFTTESESVLWRVQPKTVVQPGTKVFGHIEDKVSQNGKAYKMFKRDQQEDAPAYAGTATGAARGQKPAYKDNSDGMRQGMCINNAAQYVAAIEPKVILGTDEWANMVYKYASALYALGDLGQTKKDEIATPEEVDNSTDQTILDDIRNLGF